MKKVFSAIAKFVFATFAIAVLALLMSLTYSALGRIFPGSFANQMWGLVMFDIASMCWAITFAFHAKSVLQYAVSAIGFVVAFCGTLLMVAAEVMLSGQDLAQVNTTEIGRWMVYGFIIVTAFHALLVYLFHFGAPDIHEQINVGIARGEIVTEAISQATKQLEMEKAQLAQTIHTDIVNRVKRDLNLPILADPQMPFLPAREQPYIAPPIQEPRKKQSWFDRMKQTFKSAPGTVRNEQTVVQEKELKELPSEAGAPDNYGPAWKNSTDIEPTLDPYAWVCTHCEGTNPPYTRSCQWCSKPRTNGSPATAFANQPPPNYHPVDLTPKPQGGNPYWKCHGCGHFTPTTQDNCEYCGSKRGTFKLDDQGKVYTDEAEKPDNPFPGSK